MDDQEGREPPESVLPVEELHRAGHYFYDWTVDVNIYLQRSSQRGVFAKAGVYSTIICRLEICIYWLINCRKQEEKLVCGDVKQF